MTCGRHTRKSYYDNKLSAGRLFRCYEIAGPRIKQYLDAEVDFVISNLCGADLVLELGCGYGRVMRAVAPFVSAIVGNDISCGSLELAKSYMKPQTNYELFRMDASNMGFRTDAFDLVFCVQNGVSAFGVDRKRLVAESIRVTKDSGTILFSSYSDKIWRARLDWFRKQAQLGLIGEIDEERTRDGVIVCRDGFRASTVSGGEFTQLFEEYGLDASIVEVDESSVFCRVRKE